MNNVLTGSNVVRPKEDLCWRQVDIFRTLPFGNSAWSPLDMCILYQTPRNCNENQCVVYQRRNYCCVCGVRDVFIDAVVRWPYGSSKDSGWNKYRTCEETTPQDKKAEDDDAIPVINGAQAEKEKKGAAREWDRVESIVYSLEVDAISGRRG